MTNGALIIFLAMLAVIKCGSLIFLSDSVQLKYAEYSQPITFWKPVFNGIDFSNATERDNITRIIKSWVVDIDQQVNENTVEYFMGQSSKACKPKIYTFKQKITQITKVDFDANALLPGTLLQLRTSSSFSDGVIPAFLQDSKRNPVKITLSNGLKESFEVNPNQKAVSQKLAQILGKYSAYLEKQPIGIYVQKAANIEVVIRQLGLSTKTYQNLVLAGSTPEIVQSNEGRIVVVIFQKLFSASLDFSKTGNQSVVNLVEAVFSPHYTLDEFMQSSTYGYWGPRNLPQLVTQANYGRLLILSMDNNLQTQSYVDELTKCFAPNSAQPLQTCFDSSMSQIQRIATLRFYVGGVDPAAVVQKSMRGPIERQTVNWKKVFWTFDSPKTIQNLRPLSANLIDLLGKKFSQTESRFFSILACKNVPDIRIKITQLDGYCIAYVKGSNDKNFSRSLFDTFNTGTFQIGAKTGWQPFEIKFVLRGRRLKKNFVSSLRGKGYQYSRKLALSISINGAQKTTLDVGNNREKTETHEYVFKVNPMKENIM